MTLGAEVDECGFEAGFYAGNTTFVDIGFLLYTGAGLDVQVVQALAIYQRNTQLFGLSCVNQHSFHVVPVVSGAAGSRVRHARRSGSVSGASEAGVNRFIV